MTALFLSAVKNPKGEENGKRTNNVRSYAANSTKSASLIVVNLQNDK